VSYPIVCGPGDIGRAHRPNEFILRHGRSKLAPIDGGPVTEATQRAEKLATERHEGQFRQGPGKVPYVTHCREVAELVASHGGSEEAVIAAWLHDAVEDTTTTITEIEDLFGPVVASIVAEVTDDPDLDKETARSQQILAAPHKSPGAALVKAADQTSNMRSIVNTPPYWPLEQRLAYIAKARAVVAGLPAPASLKAVFAEAADAAERVAP